jgi:Spy/CpxP family protein refolding chaperone
MIRHWMIAAAALSALVGQPLLAQQHQHGQPQQADSACTGMATGGMMGMIQSMMSMMDMTDMMQSMVFSPTTLMRAADVLALTPDQRQRLEQLAASSGPEHQRHMQAAMDARRRAASTLNAEHPDLNAYASAFREAAEHMALAHVTMTRASLDARAVLTAAQREKLADAMALMCAVHGGGMHGGMTGGM